MTKSPPRLNGDSKHPGKGGLAMSEIKAQLQQFDLPAELKQANVGRDTESSKPPIIDDHKYECRLRVAEGLVQVLRKAG